MDFDCQTVSAEVLARMLAERAREAQDCFVTRCQGNVRGAVLRVARRWDRTPKQGEDCFKEVLSIITMDLPRDLGRKSIWEGFDPERAASVCQFACGVAKNLAREILIKGKLGICPPGDDPRDEDSTGPERLDTERFLQALMERLTPTEEKVFHQLYVEKRSPQEAADHLGISRQSVFVYTHQIKKKALALRAEMFPDGWF